MNVFTCMYVHTIQFSMTGSLHEQLETIRLFVISSEYIHTYPDELTSDSSQYKYTASVGRVNTKSGYVSEHTSQLNLLSCTVST